MTQQQRLRRMKMRHVQSFPIKIAPGSQSQTQVSFNVPPGNTYKAEKNKAESANDCKERKHNAKVWGEGQQQANGTKWKRKTNPSLSLSDCDSSSHTVCIHLSLNCWLPMHLLQIKVLFLLSGFRTASHPFCCYIRPASHSIRNSNFQNIR